MPDFFQLKREDPVHQFDSTVQDTVEAIDVDIHLFVSLEGLDNIFTLLLFSHFNQLGGLKQNSVPDSSGDQTSIESKALYASSWRGVRKDKKITEVHKIRWLLLWQQLNMEQYNWQKTADDQMLALH